MTLFQALVSSLEKENNKKDGSDSSNEQKEEGTHMIKEESSTEDIDNEMTKKLAAENKELFVSFFRQCILSPLQVCVGNVSLKIY